jgi:DMSO/TMAO reductase YedYZ molybdopterin-dependent catalytic subunit
MNDRTLAQATPPGNPGDRHLPRDGIAFASRPPPPPTEGPLTPEELQLAARNRGMPLEALRYDITPTGLHYLLTHFDIPAIDLQSWRLGVVGNVAHPLRLTFDEIRSLPRVTLPVTLECAGNGRARLSPRPISQPWLNEAIGTAEWTGTPLAGLLARADLRPGTVELVFTGADHGIEKGNEHDYARSLRVADAMLPEVMLAYEMNGRPLEPQHGFPLRLLVPGWYGMTSVKWLTSIEAVTEPFAGYQQGVAYHFRSGPDDPGTPVERIRPRALLLPPGFPDYLTRSRIVERGLCTIEGRAWAGSTPIVRVEFGIDDTWRNATLGEPLGPFAWRRWSYAWEATEGDHLLSCRATDAEGNAQPTEQPWNWQGMGNNLVQMVPVTVR